MKTKIDTSSQDSCDTNERTPYIDCYHGDYDETLMASSFTDCTGLIPSAPLSEYEVEAYSDIYQFRPEGKPAFPNDYYKSQ